MAQHPGRLIPTGSPCRCHLHSSRRAATGSILLARHAGIYVAWIADRHNADGIAMKRAGPRRSLPKPSPPSNGQGRRPRDQANHQAQAQPLDHAISCVRSDTGQASAVYTPTGASTSSERSPGRSLADDSTPPEVFELVTGCSRSIDRITALTGDASRAGSPSVRSAMSISYAGDCL
jgi:hypothetical protein